MLSMFDCVQPALLIKESDLVMASIMKENGRHLLTIDFVGLFLFINYNLKYIFIFNILKKYLLFLFLF